MITVMRFILDQDIIPVHFYRDPLSTTGKIKTFLKKMSKIQEKRFLCTTRIVVFTRSKSTKARQCRK